MGLGDWWDKKSQEFKQGAGRLVSGDVSLNEWVGNVEQRTRQVTPQLGIGDANVENAAVGILRLTSNTTGEETPTTDQVMQDRALEYNLNLLRDRSGLPDDYGDQGTVAPTPNPTPGESAERALDQVVFSPVINVTEAAGDVAHDLAETAGGAAGDAATGALKGLLSTPAGMLAVGLGGYALIQALSK